MKDVAFEQATIRTNDNRLFCMAPVRDKDGKFKRWHTSQFSNHPVIVDHILQAEDVTTYMVHFGDNVVRRLPAEAIAGTAALRSWAAKNRTAFNITTSEECNALVTYMLTQPGAQNVYVHVTQPWDEVNEIMVGAQGYIDAKGRYFDFSEDDVQKHFTATCKDGKDRNFYIDNLKDFNIEGNPLADVFGDGVRTTVAKNTRADLLASVNLIGRADWSISEHAERRVAIDGARDQIKQFLDACHKNYGSHIAAIGLGYMMAHARRDAFVATGVGFPHLHVFGKRADGKSEFAKLLYEIAKGNTLGRTEAPRSKAFARNQLTKATQIPAIYEEVHNEDAAETVSMVIKMSYDSIDMGFAAQGSQVGNNKRHKLQRSLILIGEAIVGRDAELSRMCIMRMQKPMDIDAYYNEVKPQMRITHSAWNTLLCDHVNGAVQMLRCKERYTALFRKSGLESRTCSNWAIVCAGLAYLYDGDAGDNENAIPYEIMSEIGESLMKSEEHRNNQSVMARFLADLELSIANEDMIQVRKIKWATTVTVENVPCVAFDWRMVFMSVYNRQRAPVSVDKVLNEAGNDGMGFMGFKRVLVSKEPKAYRNMYCYARNRAERWLPRNVYDSACLPLSESNIADDQKFAAKVLKFADGAPVPEYIGTEPDDGDAPF